MYDLVCKQIFPLFAKSQHEVSAKYSYKSYLGVWENCFPLKKCYISTSMSCHRGSCQRGSCQRGSCQRGSWQRGSCQSSNVHKFG